MNGSWKSLAALQWSPARMPRPPEYIGRLSCTPNSAQKYATRSPGRKPPEFCLNGRLGMVGIECREHPGQAVEEGGIGRGVDQALLVDALEHRFRAVADRIPQRRVQLGEQGARRPIPAVPEVVGDLLQAREALGDPRVDLERIERGRIQRMRRTGLHEARGFYRIKVSPGARRKISCSARGL